MELLFLSQVLGRPVHARNGEVVARIKDLVARLEVLSRGGKVTLEDFPPISGLVVELEKRPIFVPWKQVKALSPEGALLRSADINVRRFRRREGEVLLARDILDKQLIDIDGRRVIRANDLQLLATGETVRLTAVDVSVQAIARRLSFGRLFVAPLEEPEHSQREARLIAWADIEPLAAGVPDVRLRQSHERLALLNPVDIARIVEDLSYHQGAEIIESLDDETAAETLQEMDEQRQADIVEGMDQERAADILEEMSPDDAADLLGDLDEVQAEDLLRRMNPEEAEDVEELMRFPENSAGGLMTSDFIAVPPDLTVDETIARIRQMEDAPDLIDYLFVLETEDSEPGHLLGVVTLRKLLISSGNARLHDLMVTDPITIGADESQETAARTMAEYNLMALPVVDGQGNMLGIITVDDAMEVLLPENWLRRLPRVFS